MRTSSAAALVPVLLAEAMQGIETPEEVPVDSTAEAPLAEALLDIEALEETFVDLVAEALESVSCASPSSSTKKTYYLNVTSNMQ